MIPPLRLNPAARPRFEDFGPTCVLVVDDVLANPDEARALARSLSFKPPGESDAYPGLKAMLTWPGERALGHLIARQYLERRWPEAIPEAIDMEAATVDLEVPLIHIDQSMLDDPQLADHHADSDGAKWLASVLYLFGDGAEQPERGTAFWRHRQTGLSAWCEEQDPVRAMICRDYFSQPFLKELPRAIAGAGVGTLEALRALIFRAPRDPARTPFTAQECARWRLLGAVPARYNRLVAYPTWVFHSGLEPLDQEEPRLTINAFVGYPLAHLREGRYRQLQGRGINV